MTIETPLPYGRDSMELYKRKLMNPHMTRKQNHQQGAGEYDIYVHSTDGISRIDRGRYAGLSL